MLREPWAKSSTQRPEAWRWQRQGNPDIKRTEIIQIIDGTHPTRGRAVALAHQTLILMSALAISIETIPNMPTGLNVTLAYFEVFVLCVFVIEYITRIICSPRPLRYIFSFWGLVDLLSCLPILLVIQSEWAALRTLRLLRLVRLLKLLHTNRALVRLEKALHACRSELMIFVFLASLILYIAGVGIYIFEHDAQPDAFSSIPISLWWAVVSFTTVGYGDIYPITAGGRIFTTAVLFVGLGVIAVPAAIITTALINTDLIDKIEQEVEDDLREELQAELRKRTASKNKLPKRKQ